MFLTALYFLPCMVSLLWALSFVLKVKNQRQTFYMTMLFIDVFYYASTAVYLLPNTDYDMMVRMDALCVPVVFVLIAMMITYIHLLRPEKKLTVNFLLMLFPAAILGTLVNLMYYILGFDTTADIVRSLDVNGALVGEFDTELNRLYVFIDDKLIILFSLIMSIILLIYAILETRRHGYAFGDVRRFLLKKTQLDPSILKIMLTTLSMLALTPYNMLGRKYMIDHILFTSVMMTALAVIKHMLCHMEYNTTDKAISLHGLTHVQTDSGMSDEAETAAAEEQAETDVEIAPQAQPVVSTHRLDMLQARFVEEMEAGAFKDEELTLQSMADKLGVSSRTLSTMVNTCFGTPFRDILNKYRIEEAKRYLSQHPDATQSTVAFECGFKNDSVFNKKFKEIEGVTPLMWITHNTQY